MTQAMCQNEDCDKNEWRLTKPPSEYKNGVRCPSCGTTRVDYDEPEPRERQETRQDPSRAPARQEPRAEETRPARREEPELSAAEGLIATLDGDAPADVKKAGIRRVGGGLISLFQSAVDYNKKKSQMEEERATNVDLRETKDKPSCECGYTFSKIKANQERVNCPECGTEYEIVVE